MATYAEYLKANGATDEDVKTLDTPVARRAFDKMQSDSAEELKRKAKEWDDQTNKWYTEQILPTVSKLQTERDTFQADAAAERARIKALQEQGLIAVAEGQTGGGTGSAATGGSQAPGGSSAPPVDLSKYVTQDTLLQVAEREGDAIAIAQDIAYEHRLLFPDRPLNFRELRREAVQRKIAVEQLWQEKYGVTAAREARAKADRDAEIAKWKSEGAKEKETELASKYGNPDTRPAIASSNPFTNRPPSVVKDATAAADLPWNKSDAEKEQARMAKAMKGLIDKGVAVQ